MQDLWGIETARSPEQPVGLGAGITSANEYPVAPRGVRGDRESEAAATAAAPRVSKQRLRVLAWLEGSIDGLTSDQLEQVSGLSHQTASATLRHLVMLGYIDERGDTRTTQYGRQARVRRITQEGRTALSKMEAQ